MKIKIEAVKLYLEQKVGVVAPADFDHVLQRELRAAARKLKRRGIDVDVLFSKKDSEDFSEDDRTYIKSFLEAMSDRE